MKSKLLHLKARGGLTMGVNRNKNGRIVTDDSRKPSDKYKVRTVRFGSRYASFKGGTEERRKSEENFHEQWLKENNSEEYDALIKLKEKRRKREEKKNLQKSSNQRS